jgi:two-component system sensor kinase FixL
MSDPSPPIDRDNPFLAHDAPSLRLLLDSILASVPDAMIVMDTRSRILAFSAAAEKLFGYEASSVIGKDVSLLMTAIDRDYHDRYVSNYLNTGEKQIIGIGRVVEARLADGRTIPIELKIGEARMGKDSLFTGYIRDISEQRAAEHRIRQMHDELNNFARLSAVGTMASAMAHELNQPLTAVSNYLEAARDLLKTPDDNTIQIVQEALGQASVQSIRAGQIIRRLRDYVSRGEIDTQPTDLPPLISDAASLAKSAHKGPIPRVIERVDPEMVRVLADRVQIRQVLINLISNAFEAMEGRDDPTVWVTTSARDDDLVCVEVRDNGPGFSQNTADELFQPFTSSKPTGMGLGLSICQTIVEGHGGEIWAEPAPQGGASFKFTLKTAELEGRDDE